MVGVLAKNLQSGYTRYTWWKMANLGQNKESIFKCPQDLAWVIQVVLVK